ncbi:hypothetical protein [Sphingosinicella terrae]|jgi:hypothetical protein|uniref:hypothetical protein n=1 Tax=Sphingosinicella terrae TaxID=2172047 RepID=UPI000E0E080C|nr:hypothetical protein [Sphingosinicella terrae]
MPKTLVVAIAAPMLLIGAAYPKDDKADHADATAYSAPSTGPVTYRPCRPGRGDDRCIQLYERGVRTAYAQWRRERSDTGPRTRLAMGGPDDEAAAAPRPRQRQARRCIEENDAAHHDRHSDHPSAATAIGEPDEPARDGYGGETRGM